MNISRQILQLKKDLDESRYTVAITGAGISFSAGGMNFDHENVEELLPLASVDVLRNEPDRYYRFLDHAFLHSMFANEPSYAHKALRSLEIDGLLQGIITTNCGLYAHDRRFRERGGNPGQPADKPLHKLRQTF